MIELSKYPLFLKDKKLVRRIAFLESEWRRAYPSVDLNEQSSWAHAWLICNDKKYTDMSRYLNNWFRRCEKAYSEIRASVIKSKPFIEHRPNDSELPDEAFFRELRSAK